jgi:hypothetical protein
MRRWRRITNTYSDSHSYGNSDGNGNRHSYCNGDGDSHSYCGTEGNCFTETSWDTSPTTVISLETGW